MGVLQTGILTGNVFPVCYRRRHMLPTMSTTEAVLGSNKAK